MNRHTTRETEILINARHRLGLSQQQVAAIIGIQVRQYQRFEYGETEICRINLRAGLLLCTALEIDPASLVFGSIDDLMAEMVKKQIHSSQKSQRCSDANKSTPE